MATLSWIGGALAVAQVDTLTIGGTIEAGDKFNITINNKTLSVSASNTDADDVAAEIAVAWAALDQTYYPEFAEITCEAVGSGGQLTLTANTPGVPFTATVETTESNDSAADAQTFGTSTTTDSAGPNHWDSAGNWSTNTVPVDGDDVYFENSSISVLYGLSQTSIDLDSLHIKQSYTGQIGLARHNGSYAQYRTQYLTLGTATVLEIGDGEGTGSSLIKISVGSNQCAAVVHNTGNPAEAGLEAVLWKGTHASNTVQVKKGSVGIAVFAGETATVATLQVGYVDNQDSDAIVRCGSGTTLTTIVKSGGQLDIKSNVTTLTQDAGTTTLSGSATLGTGNLDGGTLVYQSTGTATTLKVGPDGVLDFRPDLRSRTVTNCTIEKGAAVYDPFETVTWSNPITLNRCALPEVSLDLGTHITIDPGAA